MRLRVTPVGGGDLLEVTLQPVLELVLSLERDRVVVGVVRVEEVDGLVVHDLVARGGSVGLALQQQVLDDADVAVVARVAHRHEQEVKLFTLGLVRELELDAGVVGVFGAAHGDAGGEGRGRRRRAHGQVLSVLSGKELQGNPL